MTGPDPEPPQIQPPPIAASLGGLYDAWSRNRIADPGMAQELDLIAEQEADLVHLPELTVDTRRDQPTQAAPEQPTSRTRALPSRSALRRERAAQQTAAHQTQESAAGGTAPAGGLLRSSAVMASGTIVSRVLGLFRVVLLAHVIGVTTDPANVWDTANNLPNLIYILLAGGVINAVLVPQITRALSQPDGGKTFTDQLLTRALALLGGVTLLLMAGSVAYAFK